MRACMHTCVYTYYVHKCVRKEMYRCNIRQSLRASSICIHTYLKKLWWTYFPYRVNPRHYIHNFILTRNIYLQHYNNCIHANNCIRAYISIVAHPPRGRQFVNPFGPDTGPNYVVYTCHSTSKSTGILFISIMPVPTGPLVLSISRVPTATLFLSLRLVPTGTLFLSLYQAGPN